MHATNPPWNISRSFPWLSQELQSAPYFLATGESKKGGICFNFLMVSKTHKGKTASQYVEKKLQVLPNALVISIGDAQLDFPMHKAADLAFHVGAERIWREGNLPHCLLVRDENGKDRQYVEGTLKILQVLQEALERDVPFNLETAVQDDKVMQDFDSTAVSRFKLLANEKWDRPLFCALKES